MAKFGQFLNKRDLNRKTIRNLKFREWQIKMENLNTSLHFNHFKAIKYLFSI